MKGPHFLYVVGVQLPLHLLLGDLVQGGCQECEQPWVAARSR